MLRVYGTLLALIVATWCVVAFGYQEPEADAVASQSFSPVNGAPLGFGVQCNPPAREAQFDPIVYPHKHSIGHNHTFFGAKSIKPDSTNSSIRKSGTTCALNDDRAAYWVPTAYNTSVIAMVAYYKPVPLDDNSAYNVYSSGLRVIAGSVPMDGSSTPSSHVLWGCQGSPNRSHAPIDCGSARAKVEVEFPNCERRDAQGHLVNDSSNHRNHMAYANPSTGRCPATHPYKVAKLNVHVIYEMHDGTQIQFSVPSHDFHADFMNGLDKSTLEQLLNDCIEGEQFGCHRVSS